jgi:hypothetical protein
VQHVKYVIEIIFLRDNSQTAVVCALMRRHHDVKDAGFDASPRATGPFAVHVLEVAVPLASGGLVSSTL